MLLAKADTTLTTAIYANATLSITELRRNPGAVIDVAGLEPITILNHNRATACLVLADAFEIMMRLAGAILRKAYFCLELSECMA